MPKKIIALKNWKKRAYLAMGAIAKSIATGLTGNANFTTPAPPVTPVALAAAGQLVIDLHPTRNNGPSNKTTFKNAVNDCNDKMVLDVDYISEQAGGDALKIESANCVASTNTKVTPVRLGNTPTPALKPLGGNRVQSKVKKMVGSKMMTHIFYDDPESVITVDIDTISMTSAHGGSFFMTSGSLTKEMGGFTANKKIYCVTVGKNKVGYGNLSSPNSTGVLVK